MLFTRIRVLISCTFLFHQIINAQQTKLTPQTTNPCITSTKKSFDAFSIQIGDTLTLPFFEDFTSTSGRVNPLYWKESQVWINNSFIARNQPNYNFATFDHLNDQGNVYQGEFNINKYVYADSLSSQHINLAFYKSGSNNVNYKIADSIYFSFFYAAGGLGDLPDNGDSLILLFKTINNQWIRVWSKAGGASIPFTRIKFPILSAAFLHKGFQFRFVNFTRATGNLNHWHVDFIYLAANQKQNEGIREIGISRVNSSLLKNLSSLPYSHFLTSPGSFLLANQNIVARNLNEFPVQNRYAYALYNRYGKKIDTVDYAASSRNLLANADSTENIRMPARLDTLSGSQPYVQARYYILPQSSDGLAINANALGNNNSIQIQQHFFPWYAYDDGSAEAGIYLDYGNIPANLPAQFAIEFDNKKEDSLVGIAVYFNQSLENVKSRNFKLRVWKKITLPPGTEKQDEILAEINVDRPVYLDSVNHFAYFYLDKRILLPVGTFYIGWRQAVSFNLNVGYDNNFRWEGQEIRNPKLYQNFAGNWDKVGFSIMGAPMMRPLFGSLKEFSFSTGKIKEYEPSIVIFPNPTQNSIFVKTEPNLPILGAGYSIMGLDGKEYANGQIPSSKIINVDILHSGVYILVLKLPQGRVAKKFIKL